MPIKRRRKPDPEGQTVCVVVLTPANPVEKGAFMKNLVLAVAFLIAFVAGMIVNAGIEQNTQLTAEYHADQAEWQR